MKSQHEKTHPGQNLFWVCQVKIRFEIFLLFIYLLNFFYFMKNTFTIIRNIYFKLNGKIMNTKIRSEHHIPQKIFFSCVFNHKIIS